MYFNNSMFPILNSSFIVGQSLFGWWTSPGIIKIWLKRKEINISSDKVINHSRRSLALSFATTCLGLIYLGYLFWYLFYLFGLAISANKIAPQTINIHKPSENLHHLRKEKKKKVSEKKNSDWNIFRIALKISLLFGGFSMKKTQRFLFRSCYIFHQNLL